MYALELQLQSLNRTRTLAVLFDWGNKQNKVDPNTNVSIVPDANVELYMYATTILGSGFST